MENSKLFQVSENGYNCSQVDEYLKVLKEEYRKLFEYAKKLESEKDSRESVVSALTEENHALKSQLSNFEAKISEMEATVTDLKSAPSTVFAAAAPASSRDEDYASLKRSLNVMSLLSEEVVRENAELRAKLKKYEA